MNSFDFNMYLDIFQGSARATSRAVSPALLPAISSSASPAWHRNDRARRSADRRHLRCRSVDRKHLRSRSLRAFRRLVQHHGSAPPRTSMVGTSWSCSCGRASPLTAQNCLGCNAHWGATAPRQQLQQQPQRQGKGAWQRRRSQSRGKGLPPAPPQPPWRQSQSGREQSAPTFTSSVAGSNRQPLAAQGGSNRQPPPAQAATVYHMASPNSEQGTAAGDGGWYDEGPASQQQPLPPHSSGTQQLPAAHFPPEAHNLVKEVYRAFGKNRVLVPAHLRHLLDSFSPKPWQEQVKGEAWRLTKVQQQLEKLTATQTLHKQAWADFETDLQAYHQRNHAVYIDGLKALDEDIAAAR